jgi:diacylglycerol kinase
MKLLFFGLTKESMLEFIKSFLYAFKGIRASLVEQRNLKVQCLVALITIGAGFYYGISAVEWCLVLMMIGLVTGLELVNTAIEDIVNLVTTEWKPLAGKVKDIAAGAVLVVSIIAVVVGMIIFKKYVLP